jgi:hypothetical protein
MIPVSSTACRTHKIDKPSGVLPSTVRLLLDEVRVAAGSLDHSSGTSEWQAASSCFLDANYK